MIRIGTIIVFALLVVSVTLAIMVPNVVTTVSASVTAACFGWCAFMTLSPEAQ